MTAVPLSFTLVHCLPRMDRSLTTVYLVNACLDAYPEVWYRTRENDNTSEVDVMAAVLQDISQTCNMLAVSQSAAGKVVLGAWSCQQSNISELLTPDLLQTEFCVAQLNLHWNQYWGNLRLPGSSSDTAKEFSNAVGAPHSGNPLQEVSWHSLQCVCSMDRIGLSSLMYATWSGSGHWIVFKLLYWGTLWLSGFV